MLKFIQYVCDDPVCKSTTLAIPFGKLHFFFWRIEKEKYRKKKFKLFNIESINKQYITNSRNKYGNVCAKEEGIGYKVIVGKYIGKKYVDEWK